MCYATGGYWIEPGLDRISAVTRTGRPKPSDKWGLCSSVINISDAQIFAPPMKACYKNNNTWGNWLQSQWSGSRGAHFQQGTSPEGLVQWLTLQDTPQSQKQRVPDHAAMVMGGFSHGEHLPTSHHMEKAPKISRGQWTFIDQGAHFLTICSTRHSELWGIQTEKTHSADAVFATTWIHIQYNYCILEIFPSVLQFAPFTIQIQWNLIITIKFLL